MDADLNNIKCSRLGLFLRSLIFSGNWNYENMQGTGFHYLVKYINKENNLLSEEAIRSQTEYFNTHPFLVNFILGSYFKEHNSQVNAGYYKKIYASAFAALGDSFFWHSLRPISFVTAVLLGFVNPIAGIIVYLTVFNIPHFFFLFSGFNVGYTLGKDVISFFNRIKFNTWSQKTDLISAFLIGFFLSLSTKLLKLDSVPFYAFGSSFLLLGTFLARKLDVVYGCYICILTLSVILYFRGF